MWQDEILEEIHQVREEHAKAFNYDLDAMFADWRQKQAESGKQVVSLQPNSQTNTKQKGLAASLIGIANTDASSPTDEDVNAMLDERLAQKHL